MPRICQDLPSTQTSAFILADTPRGVITEYTIPQIFCFGTNLTAESVLSSRPILHKEKTIPGSAGGAFSSRKQVRKMSLVADCFEDCGTVYVSVEYRLAPEHPVALKEYYGG